MLTPDLVLDGYRLIREIGRGGFGEVWLCQLEATGEYKALKFLSATNADHLERELEALIRYRTVASQIQCPHLISIEHVNRTESGLFYIMPLADDRQARQPEDSAWKAKTLDSVIQEQKEAPSWFSAEEIRAIILPLLDAAQRLSDAGIVHRDIKPENILFVGGCPCLGDISLLTDDAATLTRRGTPGYAAPSWYMETNGNPDMWGMATTLYTLVTGNPPDKLGRGAFLWPPQGKRSVDKKAWLEFHRVILRATQDNAATRYPNIDGLRCDLQNPNAPKPGKIRYRIVARDIAFIYLLTYLAGRALRILAVGQSHERLLDAICFGNGFFCFIGYIMIGCMTRPENRWKHLFAVTVGLWIMGLNNLTVGLGFTFLDWCCTSISLLFFMGIGGIASWLTYGKLKPREISPTSQKR